MEHTKKEANNGNSNTSREVNRFSNAENNNPVQLLIGLHCLSKFAFKCSIIQQRYGSSSRSAG